MASKSQEASTEDVEELLDAVDKTLERLRTLYEQYFLGIQKQAPAYIHTDVERKLRDLQQLQIRNTGLRYRLATLQQKFGSYNSYWRRTLRQIENGTYTRNLSKLGREAARTGADIPEEILAAMPKRMREQVQRDREQALAIAARRRSEAAAATADADVDVELGEMAPEASEELIALIKEPTDLRRNLKTRGGAHILDEGDSDLDLDAFFAQVESSPEPAAPAPPSAASISTPPARQSRPMAAVTPPARQTGPMAAVTPPARQTGPMAAVTPPARQTGPMAAVTPPARQTGPMSAVTPADDADDQHPTGRLPPVRVSGGPAAARPGSGPDPSARPGSGPDPITRPANGPAVRPSVPSPARPGVPAPARPGVPAPARSGVPVPVRAPSQTTRPNPIAPGSAAARGAVPVESMSGPFPREPSGPVAAGDPARPSIPRPPIPTPPFAIPAIPKPPTAGTPGTAATPRVPAIATPHATPPVASRVPPQQPRATTAQPAPARPVARAASPRPEPAPPQRPPAGMTDADVNALYAKYVKAKEMVGEKVGPGEHSKLLKTINAQAPKIMEQYNAKAVDFSVVVKDNQVVIRAKPKT